MSRDISYTNKDYSSIKESLINNAESLAGNKWTDFRESDTGVVLIELMSMLGDMLFYDTDRQALETYLTTAKEKKNIRAILKNSGYKIPTYRSSVVDCQFTNYHTEKITIPKYLPLSTSGDDDNVISYVVSEEKTISATTTETISCIQGKKVSLNLNQSDIDTKGRIWITNITGDKDVAEGTVKIYINGIEWHEVNDVYLQADSGRYFSVEFDKNDNIYINLYPTWGSLINSTEYEVDITYLKSTGSSGAVGNHMIKKIDGVIYDVTGLDISSYIRVDNIKRSYGGEDPEDIDTVKSSAVQLINTMWTAVTLDDYERLSKNYGGVANSLAWDWSIKDPSDNDVITDPYVVELYIVPNEGGNLTDTLKNDLLAYFNDRKVATIDVQILGTIYHTIDMVFDVYINSVEAQSEINSAIDDSLEEFFDYTKRSYSEVIKHSDLISVIEESHESIKNVIINNPSSNEVTPFGRFPELGSADKTFLT